MLAVERLLQIEALLSTQATRLQNYPHHKHVGQQVNMQLSSETTLEDMQTISSGS